MSKQEVLNNIKRMNFASDVLPILHLMEKNINRIEFVKDHLGLKDFVFLAERETDSHEVPYFEFPYFACFNVDIIEDDESYNFVSMNQSIMYDLNEIYKNTKQFFEESEATLYVEIGFKESIPTEEENFQVFQLLRSKEVSDIQEARLKVRKFPSWYHAKFSKEIQNWKSIFSELERIDKNLLIQLKRDLKRSIEQSLLESDEESFIIMTTRYNKICSEMY